jgi:general stress protein CsbA
MNADKENLTAQQSLDIITQMIQQAKGNARRNAFHFLLWGWVVVIANMGMYTLWQLHYPAPYVVWIITIPAMAISIYKGYSDHRKEQTTTHFDRISGWLWCGFALCAATIVFFGSKVNYMINPLIMVISMIPTLVSGVVLRFKPLIAGGLFFWAFGIVSFIVPPHLQNIVSAVAIVCGYLIPGYMLRSKKEENV